MPTITSNWKLTLGATVILDYGDELAAELSFPQKLGTDIVPTPDSSWPLLLATGNAEVSLSFTKLVTAATDKEARAAMMNHLITVAGYGVHALKVQVLGYTDRYWTFASARITENEPTRVTTGNGIRWARRYTLIAAGLTYTPPA